MPLWGQVACWGCGLTTVRAVVGGGLRIGRRARLLGQKRAGEHKYLTKHGRAKSDYFYII